MLALVVAFAVGFVAARLMWLAAGAWFAQPALLRPNYRSRAVPTAAGLLLPVALIFVEAGRTIGATFGDSDQGITVARVFTLLAVCGFCLLGTIDDVAGSGEHRGFRGHVLALTTGRLTTGLFKLVGGAAVALVVVGPLGQDAGLGRLLADAALVALSANLGNLLDRGPGRAGKAALLAFIALVIAVGAHAALAGVAVVAGAAAGLLFDDLRENLMLGDAGANPLGAALGLGVVMTTTPGTRNVVLVVVAALNLLGEMVSFSRVIDAVPPLRALDRIGTLPARRGR